MQDEVRDQSLPIVSLGSLAGFVPEGFLCVKLLSFFQLEVFQQLLQFQFSEVALYLYLPSECACQPVSRFSELPAFLHIYLDGLVQAGEGFALLCLGFVEGFLHGLEALLQRINDFRDLFFVPFPQFLLPSFQDFLGCSLHLLLDQFHLALHLFLVHGTQCFDLLVCVFLDLRQLPVVCIFQFPDLPFVGRFQFGDMFLESLAEFLFLFCISVYFLGVRFFVLALLYVQCLLCRFLCSRQLLLILGFQRVMLCA